MITSTIKQLRRFFSDGKMTKNLICCNSVVKSRFLFPINDRMFFCSCASGLSCSSVCSLISLWYLFDLVLILMYPNLFLVPETFVSITNHKSCLLVTITGRLNLHKMLTNIVFFMPFGIIISCKMKMRYFCVKYLTKLHFLEVLTTEDIDCAQNLAEDQSKRID